MTNNNPSQMIAKALTISDFEEAARAIELSDCREELLAMYRVRLADLGLDLPERIRGYAERIMAAEPIYEELHKVFSLAESLAVWTGSASAALGRGWMRFHAAFESGRKSTQGTTWSEPIFAAPAHRRGGTLVLDAQTSLFGLPALASAGPLPGRASRRFPAQIARVFDAGDR